MARLFVYGTLRHPPLLDALLGRTIASRPATLAGFRAAPLVGRAYPGLVEDGSAHTAGDLVEVDDADLRVLDDFEGPDYDRRVVAVTADGSVVHAFAYVFVGAGRGSVRSGSWSFAEFVEGAADTWVAAARPGTRHPAD